MDKSEEKKIPDDEVDIGLIGRRVLNVLSYPVVLFASNIKTTLAFVATAILLSVALKYTLPKTYESSFIIRPSDISDKLYLKVLADLPMLLKHKQYDALSEALQIPTEKLGGIAGISFKTTSYKTGADSSNYSEIILKVSDPELFLPLQKGILNHLESNPYYSKIKNLQKAQIELATKQIDTDQLRLDSLKKKQLNGYNETNLPKTEAALITLINAAPIYSLSMDHLDRKSKLMAQSVFIDRFQLIKSCLVSKQANFPPRIMILCLYMVPVFLVLCFLFLLSGRKRISG